jgi:competence protein ComFC
MKFVSVLLDILYPDGIKCIVCSGELDRKTRYGVCDRCKLPHNFKFCLKCGKGLGSNDAVYCQDCGKEKREFDTARAPFRYEGDIVKLIYDIKYGSAKYLAANFAEFMYDTLTESGFEADVITFVPIPAERKRERGYNQAEEIAVRLFEISSIECVDALERTKYVKNLARMTKHERAEAVKGTIVLKDGAKASLKGKKVVLIDDVFTSGATANECSRILRKAKPDSIFVLTFATATEKPVLY